MLIRLKHEIVKSLSLKLYFEEDIEKDLLLKLDDIVTVKYNRDGLIRTITGRLKFINDQSNSITVDGSTLYDGNIVTIGIEKILDCDLYVKESDEDIKDPDDEEVVTPPSEDVLPDTPSDDTEESEDETKTE